MVRRVSQRLSFTVAALGLAACVSTIAVPLRDGAFPRGAVQVGEDVRLTTATGAHWRSRWPASRTAR
jgi:hypothetical protein